MMNEEEYLREKMCRRNVFTVPEGYFDQLAGQIIGLLPADTAETGPAGSQQPATAGLRADAGPQPAIIRRLRPLLYAAACVAVAIAVGMVLHNNINRGQGQLVAEQQETSEAYSDNYIDDMADYAMLDNEDIYASLLADL